MKDKRVFFNPLRMLSPKLDSEAAKIDELHLIQVSEAFTLEEGLVVMLSKLMEMTRLLEIGFIKNCPKEIEACDQLADDVHKQEKLLTGNLACSVDIPPELCKLIIIFPGHLERVGDLLQSVLNCVRIKCREDVPFGDKAYEEIQKMFDDTIDLMSNFRDALIAPNKFLLEHVISQQACTRSEMPGLATRTHRPFVGRQCVPSQLFPLSRHAGIDSGRDSSHKGNGYAHADSYVHSGGGLAEIKNRLSRPGRSLMRSPSLACYSSLRHPNSRPYYSDECTLVSQLGVHNASKKDSRLH